MESLLGPEFFRGNREKLRILFTGTAPIVITANGVVQRTGDTGLPFRQDSNFWYLTGLNEPDLVLVIDKDKEYLILPERSDYQNIFDGSLNTSNISAVSGIKTVVDNADGWKKLKGRIGRAKYIATVSPGPTYSVSYGMYTNPAPHALIKKIKAISADIKLLDLSKHLASMRIVKQPDELKTIQQAINITAQTLKLVNKKLDKYKYEYEIEADLSLGFRKKGAYGHSYTPIVASGASACILHYISNNQPIEEKNLVLIDAGAEVYNYAADISRTYAVSKPTKRQKVVHSAVLEVQQFATGMLKPGVNMVEYEKEVEHFMGEKLRSLGLIKTISRSNVRKYYPHSTSHFLGLDVHDVGDYKKPLQVNTVLTVEPGIYIHEEGLGVRIEDDVLITENGAEVLSHDLPNELS